MSDTRLQRLYPWFTASSLLVGILVVVGFYRDRFREWKVWQRDYIRQETARATTPQEKDAARRIPVAIKQIVLPEVQRVDRCVTCHVAVDDPSYSGLPQPVSYHPNHDQHPFDKFGCTICHQGQGFATTKQAAHGNVKHWDRPMLPMLQIEASCAKCHHPADLPQAPKLTRGHALFQELGCIGCHKLHGRGGAIGPELDKVGAKHSPQWLTMHFKDPAAVSPGSAMPPVIVEEADIQALTLYMMSLTGEQLTEYHVSMKTIPGPRVGRQLFEEKGCVGCHKVGGKGGDVGPPIDDVATRRDAEWIVAHFRDPQALSPGTVMPKFDLTEHEIRALTEFLLSLTDPGIVGYIKIPTWMTPVERGKSVFGKYGCAGCHGRDGQGGVPNPNAKTAEQIPSLKYAAEGYTDTELRSRILNGQHEITPMDTERPPPPLYMPGWNGKIAAGEMDDLVAYIKSLLPEGDDLDF
ncbi:MAG: c-type cytochrome [Verrucomicrobia bacterium]|nr:c-type cytochrome [Verrucomicrobiota bacterium]